MLLERVRHRDAVMRPKTPRCGVQVHAAIFFVYLIRSEQERQSHPRKNGLSASPLGDAPCVVCNLMVSVRHSASDGRVFLTARVMGVLGRPGVGRVSTKLVGRGGRCLQWTYIGLAA